MEHPMTRAILGDAVSQHLAQAAGACEEGSFKEAILDLLHERNMAIGARHADLVLHLADPGVDARGAVRYAFRQVLAGPRSDEVIDRLIRAMLAPATRWAFRRVILLDQNEEAEDAIES